jgi:hypothetical protein
MQSDDGWELNASVLNGRGRGGFAKADLRDSSTRQVDEMLNGFQDKGVLQLDDPDLSL